MKIWEEGEQAKLLPMHIDALILGNTDGQKVAVLNYNYQSLKRYPSGDYVETSEFSSREQSEKGVCLHFILPEKLTHGVQKEEGGEVVYPELPNRFIVTRRAVVKKDKKSLSCTRKDWLVESDVIRKGGADYNGTSVIAYEDESVPCRFLGMQKEYDGILTSEEEHLDSFHALISGIPYFCGYYPECKSALGFFDPLTEFEEWIEQNAYIKLTYFVSGWSTKETEEPFVCHGLVTDLIWRGKDYEYETGIPGESGYPKVAVGHNVEEAAAALLARESARPELEKVMKHLFFGTLSEWEQLDGALGAERQIHQYQFESAAAKEETVISGTNVHLTEEKMQCLENIRQARKSEQLYEEKIAEKRRQIYLFWRKYTMEVSYLDTAKKEIERLIREIGELDSRRSLSVGRREELKKLLENLLEKDETLKEISGDRYWTPKDLTVAVEGAGQSNIYKKLEKYENEDGTERDTGQIVTRVKAGDAELTGEEFTVLAKAKLPTVAEKLVQEGVILLESEQNLDGKLPRKMALHKWRPSWNPLILEWSLLYYPDETAGKAPYSLENWKLCGNDYVWRGGEVCWDRYETIRGRTVLSHHGPEYLAGRFRSYINDETYEDLYDKLGSMEMLSQCMEGLNETLLRRKSRFVIAPRTGRGLDPKLAALTAMETAGMPLHVDRNQGIKNKREPEEGFYPVRAGKLKFQELRVIDNFGRVSDYRIGDVIVPEELRGQGESTGNTGNLGNTVPYVWLKPRILAPLRLEAFWDYSGGDAGGGNISAVYGWVWANLFDSCLHIYDGNGHMAGSLLVVCRLEHGGKKEIDFRNPPGETRTREELFMALHPKLRGFLEGILAACEKDPEVFYEFLKLLDESAWHMRSKKQTGGETLMFLGRPLALCGLSLCMDLKGEYPRPMFYDEEQEKEKCKDLGIPLRIGEEVSQGDGTVGFFHHISGEGFSKFHSCIKPEKENAYMDHQTEICVSLSEETKKEVITALMSPYGKLGLTCGLLPVKELALDEKFVEDALKNIYYTIYAGPVLTPETKLEILKPKEMEQEWSYLSYEQPGERKETGQITNPQMESAGEEELSRIIEGWLILKAGNAKEGEKDESGI